MEGENPRHICLRTQCGICGRHLLPGVNFVPLTGSDIGPELVAGLNIATLPDIGNFSLTLRHSLLCWRRNCWRCRSSPEAVGVHSDCFRLLKKECKSEDAADGLWMAALSRSPWQGSPNLQFGSGAELSVEFVYAQAERYGIPRLRLLPPELIHLVRHYSESGTFWRYLSVLSLARELSEVSENSSLRPSITSISLCDISSWTRGTEPALLHSMDRPPIIRLTFDCRGIKQVERLPRRPEYHAWRSENMAFVIQEASQLGEVTTQFKYNLLRLELPPSIRGFCLWDMSNPPALEDCQFCGRVPQSTRLRTIDLCGITGLTFFFSFNRIYAIHAHTLMAPCASKTFDRLSKPRQESVSWVYFPMPQGERIIALGIRLARSSGTLITQKPCFLIRTRLAGDVLLGAGHLKEREDVILCQLHPKLFIYNFVDFRPATVFGTYSSETCADSPFLPFPHPISDSIPIHHANVSSAPLKNVTRMHVFNHPELGFCRGVLFEYGNGARRAVGDCRLGVDPVTTVSSPSRICHLSTSQMHSNATHRAVRVEGRLDSEHNHDEEGWVCSAMEGSLEFWFSENESVVAIFKDPPM